MKKSAGILLYKSQAAGLEVLLVHPGGPFWAKKDKAAWSIPKGEFTDGEEVLLTAKREFREELGTDVPQGEYIELGEAVQAGGKRVYAWALQADFAVKNIHSNDFEMEWPPRSGQRQTFPEVDKAAWFPLSTAKEKIIKGQLPLLDKLTTVLGRGSSGEEKPAQASLF